MAKSIREILTNDREPSPGEFLSLRAEVISKQMKLEDRGKKAAEFELPATDSSVLDSAEQEIEGFVRSVATEAQVRLFDQLHNYAERLKSIDASGASATMQALARQSEGSFEAELLRVRVDVSRSKEKSNERKSELLAFRKRHDLARSAHPTGKSRIVLLAILAGFFLVETVPNALLIAPGDEGGILGGFVIAILFSALSLACGFISSRFGWTNVLHKSGLRKLAGATIGSICIFLVLGINLSIAHYRAAVENGLTTTEAASSVMSALIANPFALGDIISMLLIGWGILGAIVAMYDGWIWQDPYPGYTAVTKNSIKAEDDLEHAIGFSVDQLKLVESSFSKQITDERSKLRDRRQQVPQILEARKRLVNRYRAHIAHLQDVGRTLIATYRDSNRVIRKTPPPKRFAETWQLVGFDEPDIDNAAWVFPDAEFREADDALLTAFNRLQEALEAGLMWIEALRADSPTSQSNNEGADNVPSK